MINIGEERKWIIDTNNERFEIIKDMGIHYNIQYFLIQYDTDGRTQAVREQLLEERTIILPPENNRNKFIDDLNNILKDNFDYVPIFKVVNIVDELIKKGWKFHKE